MTTRNVRYPDGGGVAVAGAGVAIRRKVRVCPSDVVVVGVAIGETGVLTG
jgi:hypothetical protein